MDSTRSARSLQFESLEAREMMAVTGSLKNGVLTVTGTKYGDTVNFAQTAGVITASGVAGSWSASQVNQIVVDLKKGYDVVSFNSLANGGTQSLADYITVTSARNENDLVHLANGNDVAITGPIKHTLIVTAWGTASLNGQALTWSTPTPPTPPAPPTPPPPATNWFDSHVIDAALKSLGHSLYTDGLINRNDMISLLRSAEDGNVVDSVELSDLQAIVANSSLFGSSTDVWKLSTYIVSGNIANAKYQGQAMGNLVSGWAGTQLEKLVDKWFLGLDHPTAGGAYRQFTGQLFVGGATYTDIHQGYLGDCYFMSSLGEVALKNQAAITNMFVVNGDGTYSVRFYHNGVAEYVTVDSFLPTSAGGALLYANRGAVYNNSNNELWTALAEKAYVQINEMGWIRSGLTGNGQNTYAGIEGGYIYAALGQITGQSTAAFTYTTTAANFTTFVNAFNAGKMIGFASKSTPASSSVVGGHAYAVVGYNATNQTITLFNPWGIEYGLVTMTWAQIGGSFSYFDRTV